MTPVCVATTVPSMSTWTVAPAPLPGLVTVNELSCPLESEMLFVCSLAAFSFVFMKWAGRDVVLAIIIATLMVSSKSAPMVSEFETAILGAMLAGSIAPLVVLAIGGAAFSNEIEDRTIANLILTPIPRCSRLLYQFEDNGDVVHDLRRFSVQPGGVVTPLTDSVDRRLRKLDRDAAARDEDADRVGAYVEQQLDDVVASPVGVAATPMPKKSACG